MPASGLPLPTLATHAPAGYKRPGAGCVEDPRGFAEGEGRRRVAAEIVEAAGPPLASPGQAAAGASALITIQQLARVDGTIGAALLEVGQTEEAEAFFESVLRQASRCLREYHQAIEGELLARSLIGLAEIRRRTGRGVDLVALCEERLGETPRRFDPEAPHVGWLDLLASGLAALVQQSRSIGDMETAEGYLEEARRILDRPDPDAPRRAEHWAAVGAVAIQTFKQRVRREPVDADAAVADLSLALESAAKALALEPRQDLRREQADDRCRRLFRYTLETRRFALAEAALTRRESLWAGTVAMVRPLAADYRRLADVIGDDGPSEDLRRLRDRCLARARQLDESPDSRPSAGDIGRLNPDIRR